MLVFREQSKVPRDVDFLYCDKRCLCSDALQDDFCLVTEGAIGFCVELEFHRSKV